MDGVRGILALLSTLFVVHSVTLNDPLRRGRVVWYPSIIPGVPRIPRYQAVPRQTLVVPATIHVQWLKNGSHFRVGIVPEAPGNERCSHSSRDGMLPHSSQDEQRPHYSQDEHYPHSSEQHPHSSQEEEYPHSSQEQYPHASQDEQRPHASQDEQRPHYSQHEQHPHVSQDEQHPHYSQDEQHPHYSQDEQHPHHSQNEHHPHSSQDEQRPHSSQDDQHPLYSLFSPEEYDLTIEPPSLRGYDQFTTSLSVFDDPSNSLPVRHHDLSQLSSAAKERLKSVGTLEEALQVPGFPLLLQEDQEEPVIWTLDDPGTQRASRMHRRRGGARMRVRRPAVTSSGECEVERVSVRLQAPPGSRLIPSCVRLGKCGGCCAPGRLCTPTRINTLSVMVLQLPSNLRESRSVKRKVEEAAECRCECQIRATDCDVAIQDYDPDNCQCLCKSSLAEEQARCEASPKHHWNQLRCACICVSVRSRECSSGHSFYEDSCSCETTREE